ncbi:hypothetical protein KDL29_15235 [bacterium]|nr:hypothetical protein [bacterium]
MSTEKTNCGPRGFMAGLSRGLACLAAALLLGATPALAQQGGQNPPENGDEGMVITLKQMSENLDKFRTERDGIVVHFVLPKGWDLVEQGIDPKTGEPIQDVGMYALLARRPMPGDTPTDFIFEMDIFDRRLMEELPADIPEEDRNENAQFWGFINAQISMNARSGIKMTSEVRDINFKEYRKNMAWVPIYYESQANGTRLITFTTVVDRKLVVMKFLISKDMYDVHKGLVTLIINNSWVITTEALKEMEKEAGIKDPQTK